MRIVLIAGMMVNLLFLFPLFAIHLNIEHVLIALGQDRMISKQAAHYVVLVMPGLVVSVEVV